MEKIRVIITNNQKAVKVPTGVRMLIRRCCHAVLRMEKFEDSAEISVTFVDNEQIHELNREYRGKDMRIIIFRQRDIRGQRADPRAKRAVPQQRCRNRRALFPHG